MSGYAEWWHQGGEPWDEEVAIQLLQEAGAEVAMYEGGEVTMPDREHYHARIQEAHRVKNMEAYREAINGYVAAAREACRQKARESHGHGGDA
jgi:hypothetical protein